MTPAEIRAAVREFLDLLENDRGSEYENWCQLIRALDRLAWAYHAAARYAELGTEADAWPRGGFLERERELRALACRRFPDFGFYNQLDRVTTEVAEPKPYLVGDAIDDIASIAHDLRAAEWRWIHASEGEALYMFRLEFGLHTLEHVRHLQLYLLEYQIEQRPDWAGVP